MADKRKRKMTLTPKEQATTAAFKLQQQQIDFLKESLKNTQNELEKLREEKSIVEKSNAVLQHKQKSLILLEICKFLSSACIWVAGSFYISWNIPLCLCCAVPSIVIYIVCLVLWNK